MNDCPHMWLLDDEDYFNVDMIFSYMRIVDGMTKYYKLFPAKCHQCKATKNFTQEEWQQHKREQGY